MREPSEEQKAIARKCASVEAGKKELARTGMTEGAAIKLIAQQNPAAYNAWRVAPVQSKARPLATSKFRFRGV
jgi:hypothetical protein